MFHSAQVRICISLASVVDSLEAWNPHNLVLCLVLVHLSQLSLAPIELVFVVFRRVGSLLRDRYVAFLWLVRSRSLCPAPHRHLYVSWLNY